MPVISMPSLIGFVRSSDFYLETNTQVFTSPINKSTQRMELPGARWRLDMTLRQMHHRDAVKWKAFLLQLKGMSGTFYGYDPDYKRQGIGGGTPLVNGAGQTGTSLVIDGCPANVTGWLKKGDYYSVNGELKQATQDCDTNGSGQATLVGEPYFRAAPADNAAVEINSPVAIMRLDSDTALSWPTNHNGIYQEKTISAVEAFT